MVGELPNSSQRGISLYLMKEVEFSITNAKGDTAPQVWILALLLFHQNAPSMRPNHGAPLG